MSGEGEKVGTATATLRSMTELLGQYGCGPIQFTGTNDALYERHLLFDNVIDRATVGPRESYEAVARSVRDVLSQRWLRTEQTYERENPKRIYYLSMEFLIGRSLTNNLINLLLSPVAKRLMDEKGLDPLALLEEEPDAGLGNGGLGRLAACSLIRWRRCSSQQWATASATSTASSGKPSRMAGKASNRTIGFGEPTHGKSRDPKNRWR